MLYWGTLNGNAANDNSSSPQCPNCGMTAADLHTEGLMGCAQCYRVFDTVVTRAAAELHGVAVEEAPPLSPARIPLPWPTRRAKETPAPPPRRKKA